MIRWWQVVGATLAFSALAAGVAAQAPQTPVNTLSELMAALRACWVPPPLDQSRVGMQITVQVSFRGNGELLGQPRITFESSGASDDERLAYRIAVAKMLKHCTPVPVTEALGNALAGRPLTIRFVDNRKLRQAENAP